MTAALKTTTFPNLNHLPGALKSLCLSPLPPRDLFSARTVSRLFKSYAEPLLRELFLVKFCTTPADGLARGYRSLLWSEATMETITQALPLIPALSVEDPHRADTTSIIPMERVEHLIKKKNLGSLVLVHSLYLSPSMSESAIVAFIKNNSHLVEPIYPREMDFSASVIGYIITPNYLRFILGPHTLSNPTPLCTISIAHARSIPMDYVWNLLQGSICGTFRGSAPTEITSPFTNYGSGCCRRRITVISLMKPHAPLTLPPPTSPVHLPLELLRSVGFARNLPKRYARLPAKSLELLPATAPAAPPSHRKKKRD